MEVKRSNANIKKLSCEESFKVKDSGGGVFIEGFANKATVDRGDEIIATDAWELDNFKKNPIILFNHGMDTLGGTPVGKATEVRQTDEGLFIKVRMSNSQAPAIRMVRDLVEERILKAFSVGFDPKETDQVDIDGKSVKKITKAELFEVSIVGVPMNQDSVFELSEKALTTKSLHQIKKEFLEAKGCTKALEIESMFVDVDDRKAVLEKVAEDTGVSDTDLKDMLAGDLDIPAEVEASFKAQMEDEEDEDEEGKEKTGQEEGEGKDQEAEDSKGSDGDKDPEEDSNEDKRKDFQECVNSKVPKLLEEGKERDEAVAQAIAMCQEEGKCALTPEGKTAAYEAMFSAMEAWDGESDLKLDIPEGVTFAQVEQKQVDEGSQADQAPTEAIQTDVKQDDFGSPFLDAAKQTNVLLGTLVSEIQQLRSEIAGLKGSEDIESTEDQPKDSQNSAETDDTKTAEVDYAKKKLENFNQRLKNLGY